MKRQKVEFPNTDGQMLSAQLELPTGRPYAYALFAHCFTCGKDIAAAARIARTLAASGIGVLRFDFTGLGGSEGDFANTNFSSNMRDLICAADYLREEHAAPGLLIGHSLGGTATLMAASRIPEVKAVATIAAPASPAHVMRQFAVKLDQIETEGVAEVSLAGRAFNIEKQFIEDIQSHDLEANLAGWKRALLVMHAPFDEVVSIDEAGLIFQAARHPKSFVSLDGADHLLSKLADAQYVANTIATWASRYLPSPEDVRSQVGTPGEVWVGEVNKKFLRDVHSDDHNWLADEPTKVGGENLGPDPYEHLLAALGTCTSMTIRMYANLKKLPLESVEVRLLHSREHLADCEDCDEAPAGGAQVDILSRTVSLVGDLDASQRKRLLQIADRCPVHRTLSGNIQIRTQESGA